MVQPKAVRVACLQQDGTVEMQFDLPASSYATVLIREMMGK